MKECTECKQSKLMDEFYSHPLTKDGRIGRCKECVKKGRKTERERIIGRKNDANRWNNPEYSKKVTKRTKEFRERNPEKWNAQKFVNNYWRTHKEEKENKCRVCLSVTNIHYHHFDYSAPHNVIPCCAMCHSKFHRGILSVEEHMIKFLTLSV